MAKYVILSKITSEGLETLKENPERIKEVNEEIAKKIRSKSIEPIFSYGAL
jgi:uncharacterized protein with GYD domain